MPPVLSKMKHTGARSRSKSMKGKKKPSQKFVSAVSDERSDAEVAEVAKDPGGVEEYWAEEVVDKRFENGRTEYFVKWKNWPPYSNTWEPMEHLENSPELVERFEEKVRQQKLLKTPTGFDRGLIAKAVHGIVRLGEAGKKDLYYLVEWHDANNTIEEVPAVVARDKIPQEVIKFLSSKVKWNRFRRQPYEELEETGGDNSQSKPDLSPPSSSPHNNNDDSSTHEPRNKEDEDD